MLVKIYQDFNKIAKVQVELNQIIANVKDIHLNPNFRDIPPFLFDKNAIIQGIDNFIGNAIKYSPPESQVYIDTELKKDKVRFSVRDEGPGILQEEQSLLFKEFQTLSTKPTGSEKSTGLGLVIVKKIIGLHGGEVGFSSKVGEGSTFFFTLPTS